MFRMTLTVEGDIAVDRLLQGLEGRMQDVSPAWPTVVAAFHAIMVRSFATEGGSTGAPWRQLARSTQLDRQRQGFPPAHPILQRTEKLMRALTTGEGAFVRQTTQTLQYLLSVAEIPYFRYHQSNAPRTRLPRRAPVLLTGDDQNALMFPIRLYVTGHDLTAPRRERVG